MNVLRAQVWGFCGGVRRAVDMIEQAAARGPVYTLHEVVHNAQVMERLRGRGVIQVESLSQIPDGAAVAITAHGAPQLTLAALRARGLTLIDATCPIVRDAQRAVFEQAKAGRFVIIYGDRDHLEVRGLLSQAAGQAVSTEALEGLAFPAGQRLAVVAQTTQSPEALEAFARDLRAWLGPVGELEVLDTTCPEPAARYRAGRELAVRVDAVVVVGSPTSSNTRKLHEACASVGRPTFFVEDADGLDASLLSSFSTVGLTAGASTPDEVIDAVETRLREL